MLSRALERLQQSKPWDNVSEEDLYRVDGLWLSIRGSTRSPLGVWCTDDRTQAEAWISHPDEGPGKAWSYDAASKAKSGGTVDEAKVLAALDKVLDQYEGESVPGLEFPVYLNPESDSGESLPVG